MKFRGPIGALGALVLGLSAAAVVTLSASPASATGDKPHPKPSGRCVTLEREAPGPSSGTQDVSGGAQISTADGWVQFKTPSDDATTEVDEKAARARWTVNPEDFKLKDLKSLTYTTKINEDGDRGSVAPAVRLVLVDGTTLVYEPYWNGTVANGDYKHWTVTKPTAKLWDNGAEPAADETFADWIKPERKGNVLVKEISIGVGTYNEGADVWSKNLRFTYLLECKPLDVVVAQPTCDVDEMLVKFTNPNTKVNAWLWTSAELNKLTLLKPGKTVEFSVTTDLKYAYFLQVSKFGGTFNAKKFKHQMNFTPGAWIVNTVEYVEPESCPTPGTTTTPPATTPPATTAPPTTTPPTSAPPTSETPVPVGNESDDDGSLPQTGTPTLLLGGGGLLLVVVGALLFLLTRRRRQELDETAQLPVVR